MKNVNRLQSLREKFKLGQQSHPANLSNDGSDIVCFRKFINCWTKHDLVPM